MTTQTNYAERLRVVFSALNNNTIPFTAEECFRLGELGGKVFAARLVNDFPLCEAFMKEAEGIVIRRTEVLQEEGRAEG